MCQLLKGTTKEKTHKKQTKKKHFVSGLGKDCSVLFSVFFSFEAVLVRFLVLVSCFFFLSFLSQVFVDESNN